MSPFAITVLKVAFLGLLYFFIYRAFLSVVVELRPPGRKGAGPPAAAAPPPGLAVKAPTAKGPPPSIVEVLDAQGAKVQTLALEGTIQVGRAEACQIKCSDTFVSAFHARLFRRDGLWYVEDIGSTNGTFLNQLKVTSPVEVRAGDRVVVGRTMLELRP